MLAGSHLIFANALFSNLTHHSLSAFILGIISHHLADRIPHLDLNFIKSTKYNDISFFKLPIRIQLIVYFEFLLGIIFTYYYFIYFHKMNEIIIFCLSLGAIMPDIINIFLKEKLNKISLIKNYIYFHKKFHFRMKENESRAKIFLYQVIIILFALIFFRLTLIA
ncbi:MAG: hypothetical protein NZ866_02315 [Patescibacteria group bacterium]|nr:hypothetical protein [Patescibacteria group bacterium]